MKRTFNDFATYIRLYDGHGKPRLDWQAMYKLFPKYEFIAGRNFGQYENFGEAFEHMKQLNEIDNISFAIAILEERCIKLNPYSPLSMKIGKTKHELENIKYERENGSKTVL